MDGNRFLGPARISRVESEGRQGSNGTERWPMADFARPKTQLSVIVRRVLFSVGLRVVCGCRFVTDRVCDIESKFGCHSPLSTLDEVHVDL